MAWLLHSRLDPRRVVVVVAVVCTCVVAVVVEVAARPPAVPPLYSEGIATSELGCVVAVPPQTVARYIVGTSLLDSVIAVPGAALPTVRRVQAARTWLGTGRIPRTSTYREMYDRALLDLRALTLANGAFLAARAEPWFGYVWPRDASFAVAAFSAGG